MFNTVGARTEARLAAVALVAALLSCEDAPPGGLGTPCEEDEDCLEPFSCLHSGLAEGEERYTCTVVCHAVNGCRDFGEDVECAWCFEMSCCKKP